MPILTFPDLLHGPTRRQRVVGPPIGSRNELRRATRGFAVSKGLRGVRGFAVSALFFVPGAGVRSRSCGLGVGPRARTRGEHVG